MLLITEFTKDHHQDLLHYLHDLKLNCEINLVINLVKIEDESATIILVKAQPNAQCSFKS